MQACLQLWGQWDFGNLLLLLLLASGSELWSMGQCTRPGDVGTAVLLPALWLPRGTMCWRVLGRGIKDYKKISALIKII